ncbi:hypothetical protein NY2A_B777L [Paramecium bursaria Chlorella virus NY2A]|uniref:Uncharacterized protein B777L n=1 Tax=Paramecium bursaria Chlorella virus NY2A TaxID=46021 RepID=A7IXV2_PBCVN|nr:hypothetical protein NY2A_B777L [Paramecium bursaria Chlorella virus NY2A]ABT15176.1 hypothetical protein NY2A_B777L [Paramecium bursaria Chlorella virus NY2A]
MPRKCTCDKKRQSLYGRPGDSRPTWCSKCPDKPDDAINVVSKKCMCGNGCPIYGFSGQKAQWCFECKPDDAINVVSKKCTCGKRQPIYGFSGEKAQWCSDCKPDEAIDVKNKKCLCGKHHPTFGLPGEKAEFCSECKPYDATDVVHKKCTCGKGVNFGLPDEKAQWCSDCKPDEAIDVMSKMCPGYEGVPCPVRTRLVNGKAYCLSCDPDESRRLSRKKYEHAFFCFLDKHDIGVTQREYRIDYRCVDTNKSHAFIDGVIITPDIVLCLEVDENAHRQYEPGCDKARMHLASTELLLAFPKHHISWIRVNPTIDDNDRSDKALKIRDERYFEAVLLIRDFLHNPRTEILYIGY